MYSGPEVKQSRGVLRAQNTSAPLQGGVPEGNGKMPLANERFPRPLKKPGLCPEATGSHWA